MTPFTTLYLDLDSKTSTDEKVRLLESYFSSVPADDAAWALAFFTGKRPKGATSTRALQLAVLEATGLPSWIVSESREAVGDFAETCALLAPGADEPTDEPLHVTIRDRVLPLARLDEGQRRALIRDAWTVLSPDQRLVYHKLIRGGFRVGVQRRLVARALARVAGIDHAVMAHRLSGPFQPNPDALRNILAPDPTRDDAARPYPFFLAHQLEGDPASLGDRERWQAEWKWDGIRAQLVRRPGVNALWSRGEEIVTDQFPEVTSAAASLPEGLVLDGEILVWRDDAPRPFASLQTRLNRKTKRAAQLDLFATERVIFMAYDLLEHEGRDVRERPLRERRASLEALIERANDDTIRLSPVIDALTWNELEELRTDARARNVEGIMLKPRDLPYGVGRTKRKHPASDDSGASLGWWKWKVDPLSADAVLIYAQAGSGRRAGLFTDYTFAVWDDTGSAGGAAPDFDSMELVPFAKAYSGLTREEIERVDSWIRKNTIGRVGPMREVRPELVFEIAFEAIQPSNRHRAGLAVRFPRIIRWRFDKKPPDADTLSTLRGLLPEDAT